tara:strand:- start:1598 stop:1840 length:243 start_codon:yes stop_codon:yes gene_type:complete
MNARISKDWFANVLSRFIAFEMDEEEQQKFIEKLIQDWMYGNKQMDLRLIVKHLNQPDFGRPINKLESDTFWIKELYNIK